MLVGDVIMRPTMCKDVRLGQPEWPADQNIVAYATLEQAGLAEVWPLVYIVDFLSRFRDLMPASRVRLGDLLQAGALRRRAAAPSRRPVWGTIDPTWRDLAPARRRGPRS